MKTLLIFLLTPVLFFAQTVTCSNGTWSGSTCTGGTHPLTYYVCGTGGIWDGATACTGSSGVFARADLQAVANDQQRGDTVKLEPGATFTNVTDTGTFIGHITLRGTTVGSSGYTTWTTMLDAKLPAEGTRITPAYAPLMPKFVQSQTTRPLITITGSHDTAHFKVRGINFTMDQTVSKTTTYTGGYLQVGPTQGGQTTYDQPNIYPIETMLTAAPTVNGSNATVQVADSSWATVGKAVVVRSQSGSPSAGRYEKHVIASVPDSTHVTFQEPIGVAFIINDRINQDVKGDSDLPDDIVVEHCLFTNPDHMHRVGFMLTLNARSATVRDNFIDGAMNYDAADSQGLRGINTRGPYTIENNYIHGNSENMMFGGGWPAYDVQLDGVTVRYNFFPKYAERDWMVSWRPSTLVWKGHHAFSNTTGSGSWFAAQCTGTTGSSEPTFSTTTTNVSTTTDNGGCGTGGVTWLYTGSGNPNAKNNFEIKTGRNYTIQYNVFDGWWEMQDLNTTQHSQMNIKSPNQGSPACQSPTTWPDCYLGKTDNVSILNNIFRIQSGSWLALLGGSEGKPERSGGYTVRNNFVKIDQPTRYGVFVYPTKDLTTGKGSVNWDTDRYTLDHNTVVTIPANMESLGITSIVDSGATATITTSVPHWWYVNYPVTFSGITGAASAMNTALSITRVLSPTSFLVTTSSLNSNTGITDGTYNNAGITARVWATAVHSEASTTGTVFPGFSEGSIRNNIFFRGKSGLGGSGVNEGNSGATPATSMLLSCTTCSTTKFARNAFLGAPTSAYPPSEVYSGCSDSNSCSETGAWTYADSTYGSVPLLKSFPLASNRADLFRVNPSQTFARARSNAIDGRDIGADLAQLPEIRGPDVTPTDRAVLFRWTVTDPIKDVPCVAEIHTSPDMESTDYAGGTTGYAAELSQIGAYYRQDADNADRFVRQGLNRMLVFGHSVNLSPSTTYYWRLMCGGDSRRGSFVTQAAKAGTTSQVISRKALKASTLSMVIEYGTYSAATNSISSASTASANCTVGNSCNVTLTGLTSGTILTYRYLEKSATGGGGSTLLAGPFQPLVVQ